MWSIRLSNKIGVFVLFLLLREQNCEFTKVLPNVAATLNRKVSEHRKLSFGRGGASMDKTLAVTFQEIFVKTASHWKITNSTYRFS